MTEPVAASVFRLCALYLIDEGWYRDGDDPWMWRDPRTLDWQTFGDALMLQLNHDGVSMLDVVAGA